jgi:hypothetical protein
MVEAGWAASAAVSCSEDSWDLGILLLRQAPPARTAKGPGVAGAFRCDVVRDG